MHFRRRLILARPVQTLQPCLHSSLTTCAVPLNSIHRGSAISIPPTGSFLSTCLMVMLGFQPASSLMMDKHILPLGYTLQAASGEASAAMPRW